MAYFRFKILDACIIVIDKKKQKSVLFSNAYYSVLALFLFNLCLQNNFVVRAQKIDCTSGYLCDFFNRFPHLPFSQTDNSGYIRTLDYMISKDKDVVPRTYYSTNAVKSDNYYKNELSEIRKSPLYRVASPSNTVPAIKKPVGRKYEPKVCPLSY